MSSVFFGHPVSVIVVSLLLVLYGAVVLGSSSLAKNDVSGLKRNQQVYIVYLGRRQHEDPELLIQTHHELLVSVLESEEAATELLVYNYRHGFSGFAAKLTPGQAELLSESPEVVAVIPNHIYKVQTTRSWDYLGLSSSYPNSLLHESNMGDGVIIGLLDTGIWPESEVFRDEGLGAIPSRWKGTCEFSSKKNCNKKLIGARYFIKGLEIENGGPLNLTENPNYLSPRDIEGHGTHTSTTAGGSPVTNVSFRGMGFGTVRGGAPRARLAMYKVCWNVYGGICATADILKAFDQAIHDGVDVLSLSIASDIPSSSSVDMRGFHFGSFHAVLNGITVVCAAGNLGPASQTVQNTDPWLLTVAASSVDRSFPTPVTLGSNQTMMGQGLYTGNVTGFIDLVYPEVSDLEFPRDCSSLTEDETWAIGKVVLCFTSDSSYIGAIVDPAYTVKEAGALGLIVAKNPSDSSYMCPDGFPCIQVNYELGYQILFYIRSTSNPRVRISPSQTRVGKPVSTTVAHFSSRGPSSIAPAILKPDIAAPGVKILAAVSPDSETNSLFEFMSGTSMATPHVSGIVALLKALHPSWSPAAIKSAIITTARTTGPHGEPIYAEGDPMKLSDPFDYGGGIVNPDKAMDPGLIYDMSEPDYVGYLCSVGYNESSIYHFTGHPKQPCTGKNHSILDLNIPSFTVPNLKTSATLRRTVTNVGPPNSRYEAVVLAPPGVVVTVNPRTLVFSSKVDRVSFVVGVSTTLEMNTGYVFGSLSWTDGDRVVRSPISVKVGVDEFYD